MPTKPKRSPAPDADTLLAILERQGTKRNREGMARYAIPSDKAFGVSVGALQRMAKGLAPDHDLAAALWKTGWYEARMLASMVDDPVLVTSAQMDRWCRDFDNWAICDHVCFKLFDRTPHAWDKVGQWAPKPDEFVRRAAFALLWASDGARQEGRRRQVPRRFEAHRAIGHRRPALRQEGGQHGAPRDRQAQPRAPRCRGAGGSAAGGVAGSQRALGGKGCLAGADQRVSDSPA